MKRIPATQNFQVIAHRGASGYAPENTLAAFRLADEMKVRDIEFDLQLTRDGEMVVVHDRVLDRYGHSGCVVAEMTLAELKTLDMGAWFKGGEFAGERMLTAAELFDAYRRRFVFHAEIKDPSVKLVEAFVGYLARVSMADTSMVTSFDFDILTVFRTLLPDQPVGWLVREGSFTDDNVERAAAAGFRQFCPAARDVTPERVERAKKCIGSVRAHGIKSPADAERVILARCDGMTLNWPDWVIGE